MTESNPPPIRDRILIRILKTLIRLVRTLTALVKWMKAKDKQND